MLQLTEEDFLTLIKKCEGEVYTMAEIHKVLIQNSINCSIEEVRGKLIPLHRDGYIGKELTNDGVSMFYLIFNPSDEIGSKGSDQ